MPPLRRTSWGKVQLSTVPWQVLLDKDVNFPMRYQLSVHKFLNMKMTFQRFFKAIGIPIGKKKLYFGILSFSR
jgi:hypothetical protein